VAVPARPRSASAGVVAHAARRHERPGEPARPGRGELPLERGAGEQPQALGHRVLVVDDEPAIRLLCTINLDLAGYRVDEAGSGEQALELLRAGSYDLVLLDVMLPDMGGHEIARRLAAGGTAGAPPVAFLSARAEWADVRAGYEAGAVDYITKPFDPVELAARVAEILGRVQRGESEQYRRARLAELGE
jgi:DNA-binding response OmpR family regulator